MSSTYIDSKYHVIIRTRDEEPLITAHRRDELYRYVHGIVRNHKSRALRIGGMGDHLHLLLGIHPETAVADMLRLIKANSSKWLNERGDRRGWFGWKPGYAAFTVSPTQVPKVQRFIMSQEEVHRRMSFGHEYRRIIEKHGLDFEGDTSGCQRDTHAWLGFHFVLGTKQRMPLITSPQKERVFRTLTELVTERQGRLLEVGGMPDHVHLLAEIPRTVAVADILQTIKSTSSHRLGQDDGRSSLFAWQRGYGAFSVSRSQMSVVAQYIQRQAEHHQGMSFDDELRKLLAEHGLALQNLGREAQDQR
ncbi:MAG: IS200/IS605 family transposase [bacterium]|nr:IS200/IS605 family transposase [bacterium]